MVFRKSNMSLERFESRNSILRSLWARKMQHAEKSERTNSLRPFWVKKKNLEKVIFSEKRILCSESRTKLFTTFVTIFFHTAQTTGRNLCMRIEHRSDSVLSVTGTLVKLRAVPEIHGSRPDMQTVYNSCTNVQNRKIGRNVLALYLKQFQVQ